MVRINGSFKGLFSGFNRVYICYYRDDRMGSTRWEPYELKERVPAKGSYKACITRV